MLEQKPTTQRRGWSKCRPSLSQSAEIRRVLAVYVFTRIEGGDGSVEIDPFRQRREEQHTVDSRIPI
jgi:hypothetical protein